MSTVNSLGGLNALMPQTPAVSANALAIDGSSLNALKFKAGQDGGKTALKEAAKQFESLFMRELIKSMREATTKSGLMDGDVGEDMATDMLDQQMAVQMTGLPGGLSEAIERQLALQMGNGAKATDGAQGASAARVSQAQQAYGQTSTAAVTPTASQTAFVARHGQAATRVASEVGIPASFMLGQAGHETGWGRGEIKNADGSNSFNLFGIKATGGWKGKVAEVTTTEYVNGEAQKVTAKFRAYDSYEDSFRDYARLVSTSPRYQGAMQNLGSAQAFASQLQKAGYATDPQYAAKLSRAINTTLTLQRFNQA
jgi:flagellar protein FlgJ